MEIRNVLSNESYTKFKAALATISPANPDEFKYVVIYLLMGEAGLRVGEAVRLRWEDLWYGVVPANDIRILAENTKTRVGRSVPQSRELSAAVAKYNKHLPYHRVDPHAYLFAGRYNNDGHISERAVQLDLAQYSYKILGYAIHPHTLRHTFASRMMRRAPLRVVQELLGHKSITSTQVYTHPDATDLNQAINGKEETK